MDIISNFLDSVHGSLQINPSTFSGAIDIIVVEQPDGSFKSTAFHVRFGKVGAGVLKPRGKIVRISVNEGPKLPFKMVLSEQGEAFFFRSSSQVLSESGRTVCNTPPEIAISPPSPDQALFSFMSTLQDPPSKPAQVAGPTPPTEAEQPESPIPNITIVETTKETTNKTETTQASIQYKLELSTCGNAIYGKDLTPAQQKEIFNAKKLDYQHMEAAIIKDSTYFFDRDLVFCLDGKYYSWTQLGPVLITLLAFGREPSSELLAALGQPEGPEVKDSKESSAHDPDEIETVSHTEEDSETQEDPQPRSSTAALTNLLKSWLYSSPSPAQATPKRPASKPPSASTSPTVTSPVAIRSNQNQRRPSLIPEENEAPIKPTRLAFSPLSSPEPVVEETKDKEPVEEPIMTIDPTQLFPTSDELKSMGLKPGVNTVTFSVFNDKQDVEIRSRIFLWGQDEQLVISDVDGTITKSDVFGHIFAALGQDWSHIGVAELFTNIASNGYQVLYLTARSVGYAGATKDYLSTLSQEVQQPDGKVKVVTLPEGPVLLSPTRLLNSLNREIIKRNPQEFKIACLKEIKDLFPSKTPFYAGFGNRHNDHEAYDKIGINPARIFIINVHGEISCAFGGGSYSGLNEFFDLMFPPLRRKKHSEDMDDKYGEWQFWRSSAMTLEEVEREMNSSTK